jgi:hypothetical protein
MKTKAEVQPWWRTIRAVAAKSTTQLSLGSYGDVEVVTKPFCEEPEQLVKVAHSLAVSNAYQIYKEALGEPPQNDTEMQNCRETRDRIVHDFELISQDERDRCLDVIAARLLLAGLID